MTTGKQVFTIFLITDLPSYIYLNAIKGLSTMSDVYGRRIIEKLVWIYRLSEGNTDNTVQLDKRLRVGEALLQTIQRCGETLGRYGGLQTMTMGTFSIFSFEHSADPTACCP